MKDSTIMGLVDGVAKGADEAIGKLAQAMQDTRITQQVLCDYLTKPRLVICGYTIIPARMSAEKFEAQRYIVRQGMIQRARERAAQIAKAKEQAEAKKHGVPPPPEEPRVEYVREGGLGSGETKA